MAEGQAKEQTAPQRLYEVASCSNCMCHSSERQTFGRCSGCGMESYCSEKCQKEAWLKHKDECFERRMMFDRSHPLVKLHSRLEQWQTWISPYVMMAGPSALQCLPDSPGSPLVETHALILKIKENLTFTMRARQFEITKMLVLPMSQTAFRSNGLDPGLATSAKELLQRPEWRHKKYSRGIAIHLIDKGHAHDGKATATPDVVLFEGIVMMPGKEGKPTSSIDKHDIHWRRTLREKLQAADADTWLQAFLKGNMMFQKMIEASGHTMATFGA